MVEEKWQVSAAVILILGILIAFVLYVLFAPPSQVVSILGNFSSITNTSSIPVVPPNAYQINSYIGGIQNSSEMVFPFGSFSISYQGYNSSISENDITLTSSIFGSANYNLKFYGNSSDVYTLNINLSSVSGDPYIYVYLNGKVIYSGRAVVGQFSVPVSGVTDGQNVISIYNYMNGLALYQSFTINKLSLVQTRFVNLSVDKNIQIPTFLGLGSFYLEFTPIGYGNLNVYINNYNITSITSGSDTPQNITIPQSIINNIISSLKVNSNDVVMPVNFNIKFAISSQGKYVIVDNSLDYVIPSIPQKTVSIPFSIHAGSANYVVSLYVSSIPRSGYIEFSLSPSNTEFYIPASSLKTGDNILVEPASVFSGNIQNGNYTGIITLSSNGLVVPSYLYIYPV